MDGRPSWAGGPGGLHNVTPGTLFLAALGLGFAYWVGTVIYNLFFHPLRHFPGPKLNAISLIPYTLSQRSGDHPRHLLELSKKYGFCIRTGPGILSVVHPDGMSIIRGHRKGGKDENPRDPIALGGLEGTLFVADREEHGRLRRTIAAGFSNQAMMEQEPVFREYGDKLIEGMRKACSDGTRPLELTSWFNWATFDVIGDLAFGEPFGCLDNASYHPWVSNIFSSVKEGAIVNQLRRYGRIVGPILAKFFLPRELAGKNAYHRELSKEKVTKRIESGVERPDYITMMINGRKGKGDGLSMDSIVGHAAAFIIAGSETTATTMSGATYFLTTHPEVLARVTAEIRQTFADTSEITLHNDVKTPYLQAVLEETMRLYSAAPSPSPRIINKDGEIIDGKFVPPGTLAESPIWAINRHPDLFYRPDDFIPERWLGTDARFKNDRLDAVMPFGHGPRVCLGKNLAYAEMRMLMSKVLWNFDLSLAEESKKFDFIRETKAFTILQKPPLYVNVKPRKD